MFFEIFDELIMVGMACDCESDRQNEENSEEPKDLYT